jgi:hypothetical protein
MECSMSRSGNPNPSSGHSHPSVGRNGEERKALIEKQTWPGFRDEISSRAPGTDHLPLTLELTARG